MQTLPLTVEKYSQTPSFTKDTVPKGLLKDHSTKAGVWGRLVVESGIVEYTVVAPEEQGIYTIAKGEEAVIVPQQLHFVKLLTDDTVFRVEFLK